MYAFLNSYFPKFSVQPFQSTLTKSLVTEFRRVLDCRLQFTDEFPFQCQPTIFLKMDLSIDVVLQVIVKILCSKHVVIVFNFSKKDPSQDLLRVGVLKMEFVKGILLKAFCSFGNSRKFFCPLLSLQHICRLFQFFKFLVFIYIYTYSYIINIS